MNRNCQRALLMETSYTYVHFLRKQMDPKPKFRKTCDRVHSSNVLEEEGLCKGCSYCKFVKKLNECLEKKSFSSANNTVERWEVVSDDENVELTPLYF